MTHRGELHHLWSLAAPVILGQVAMVAMGAVDLMMVGPLGEVPLAAVGMGNLWSFGVLILGIGVLRGTDPVFSQGHGANDRVLVGASLARVLLLSLLLTVPLDLLHRVSGPVLHLLEQPAAAIQPATAYVSAVRWGIAPLLLFTAVSLFLQNLGRTLLPTLVLLGANVVNVLLNTVLIYGLGWGVAGCGWATSVCRLLSLVALVILSWRVIRSYPWPSPRALLSPAPMARLLLIGGPVGVQYGIEVWAFNATGLMMGWLGTTAFAAHLIVLNITSLTFMVPLGLGIAASTRVGNLLGAGRSWASTGWMAVVVGGLWMVVCAVVLWLLGSRIAGLYTPDAAVLAVAVSLIPLAAMFQIFDGVQAVAAGVLRGAGATRSPALVNLIGFWFLGLPIGYLWGVRGGVPHGVWGGLVVGLAVVSVLLVARLRQVARLGGFRQVG